MNQTSPESSCSRSIPLLFAAKYRFVLLKKVFILHYTHGPCRQQQIAPKIDRQRSFLNQVGRNNSTHGFCLKREHMSTCCKLKKHASKWRQIASTKDVLSTDT